MLGLSTVGHDLPMTSRAPSYPFVPKSNTHLRAGHYWPIPLSNGRFSAGVVVAVPTKEQAPLGAINLRSFIAGLLAWSGDAPPIDADLRDAELLAWGGAHVKMVALDGGQITGRIDRPLNQIRTLSHRMGGTVWVYTNGTQTAPATDSERTELPIMSGWGFQFARVLSERVFVRGLDIVP